MVTEHEWLVSGWRELWKNVKRGYNLGELDVSGFIRPQNCGKYSQMDVNTYNGA